MLSMEQVSFSYPRRRKHGERNVFTDLSLAFYPGTVYGLYGPSGVGKTTCLALLGGLERPTSGRILLDGTDIQEIGGSKLRREQVAFVFQEFHLFAYMTAVENVMMAVNGNREVRVQQQKRAKEILTELQIPEEDQVRPISRLSGGQKQRVAIARALITDATYILADEPTGNLDRENTEVIMGILKRLASEQNKCVIIVTHSERIREICDQIIRLEDL